MAIQRKGNTLIISDIHFPYHHPDSFDFLEETAKRWKCTRIRSSGDMFDLHRTGKHLPEPESLSMDQEIKMGKVAVKVLSKIFPRMQITFGNHDLRAVKAVKEKGITSEMLRPIGDLFECPKGWEFGYEFQEDGVIYKHGDGYSGQKGALECAMKHRMSSVIGHLHSYGGVHYHNNGYDRIFGLNVGCLINDKAPAFKYSINAKDKSTLGCGVVIEGGKEAYFVPMV